MPQLQRKSFVIVIGLMILLLHESCKQPEKTQAKDVRETFIPVQSGCYQMIIKEDTAFMKLDVNGNTISGDLNYRKKEKDNNTGSFTGTVTKDTLDMMYAFMSEGMISHRQIKMIHLSDGFAEGYGELEVSHDTAFFKYPNGLQFETNHLYKKIKCP